MEGVHTSRPGALAVVLQPPTGAASRVLRVHALQTVDELYCQAEAALNLWPGSHRIVFGGRELSDARRSVGDYRMHNGCTLQVVRRNVGGSAAARAQMGMKRKKERKQMTAFLAGSSSSEDEPDDYEPIHKGQVEALLGENEELKELMERKMTEFLGILTEAVDGGDLEVFEELDNSFDKLLYHGFCKGKGFYAVDHKHANRHGKQADADADAEGEGGDEDEDMPAFQQACKGIVENSYFKNFVIGCICVAGVIVGANTYLDCGAAKSCFSEVDGSRMWGEDAYSGVGACLPAGGNWTADDCMREKCCFHPGSNTSVAQCWNRGRMPECAAGDWVEDAMDVMNVVDSFILYVFTFECLVTILSFGTKPWLFFTNPWNAFDFVVVVACYLPGGDDMAVLRLFRLMRLLKLLHAIENLQIVLHGLVAGFGSISYILILMLLVYYLFSIMGIMVFKGNDSVHFQDLHTAMITLFRVATMEDWTDVMYINMLGCDKYGYGSYCYDPATCALGGCEPCDDTCTTPDAHGWTSVIFFSVFVVIAGFVVMSLFIGVITTSMAEAQEEHTTGKRGEKQKKAKEKMRAELVARKKEEAITGVVYRASDLSGDEDEASDEEDSEPESESDEEDVEKQASSKSELKESYVKLGGHCEKIVEHNWFGAFITFCILIAALVIGVQTYFPRNPELERDWGPTMESIDAIILGIFTVEVVLKIVAAKLRPWTYFHSAWNVFDFTVVTICYMPFGSSMVAVLRLLRLLRVLKLLKAVPQLQIILSGLVKGMASIGYIGLLLILLFYVMGVMAIMFFRDNDPVHFGTLHGTMVTLFRCSTFEDWTDVMYISMFGCQMWSYGTLDDRCENSTAAGLWAAMYFHMFILFSALIMLNLVIGSICSAMGDAQEAYEMAQVRTANIRKVVAGTKAQGKEYGIKGISWKAIDAWSRAFEKMDSATSPLALEASLHRHDLDFLLEFIGEPNTLKKTSREKMLIRANHTLPIGLISLTDFIDAVANDVMTARIKDLAKTTGYLVVESLNGLLLDENGFIEDELDPFVTVTLNGTHVGKTHRIKHAGGKPEWHERVSFPAQLLKPEKNIFRIEVSDHGGARANHDLLGTLTVMSDSFNVKPVKIRTVDAEGNSLQNLEMKLLATSELAKPTGMLGRHGKELNGSLNFKIIPPEVTFQSALQQVRRLNRLTGGKMSLGAISTPGAPKRSASSRSMHPTCSADATQTNDDKVANGDSSSSSSGDVTGDDASAEKKKAIFLDI